MNNLLLKENFKLFILALLVLLSRLPFLNAGYGVEEDSWGIAVAAYHTQLYGVMEASRLPGHPVNELIYSIFWGHGPWLYNFFSAICSVICFILFYLTLKKLNFKNYEWAALALVFTPVVYINSTCTIDYLWALMFAVAAFYALIHFNLFWAALFLGLAVGCRINTAVLYIPFLIYIYFENNKQIEPAQFFKFSFVFGIVSLLCFIPIICVYGWDFFTYSDQFPYPSIAKIIYKASIGVVGLLAFIVIFILLILKFINPNFKSRNLALKYLFFSLTLLQILAYLMLPQKSAYLMLLVPFGILWFADFLNVQAFKVLCFSLMLSSFVMSVNLTDPYRGAQHSNMVITKTISGQELFLDPFTGPVISDYTKRLNKLNYTAAVFKEVSKMNAPTIIICGWWFNQIIIEQMDAKNNGKVKYAFYLNPKLMEYYLLKGYQIYYLSEQEVYNDLFYKFSRTKSLASPLLFDYWN